MILIQDLVSAVGFSLQFHGKNSKVFTNNLLELIMHVA